MTKIPLSVDLNVVNFEWRSERQSHRTMTPCSLYYAFLQISILYLALCNLDPVDINA